MISKQVAELLNQYFDKIYVVTLERATERQQKFTHLFQGVEYEFFMGVDKTSQHFASLPMQEVYNDKKARELDRYGKGMIAGGIACALSHRNLYQRILEEKYERVLIFEDDAVPLPSPAESLQSVFDELPNDWELLYLGYTKHETVSRGLLLKQSFYRLLTSFSLMKWSRNMVDNFLPTAYSAHLRKAGYHDCTHAYAVSSASLQKLIDFQTPVVFCSDDLLSDMIIKGNLRGFITEPKFFDQDHFLNPEARSYIND